MYHYSTLLCVDSSNILLMFERLIMQSCKYTEDFEKSSVSTASTNASAANEAAVDEYGSEAYLLKRSFSFHESNPHAGSPRLLQRKVSFSELPPEVRTVSMIRCSSTRASLWHGEEEMRAYKRESLAEIRDFMQTHNLRDGHLARRLLYNRHGAPADARARLSCENMSQKLLQFFEDEQEEGDDERVAEDAANEVEFDFVVEDIAATEGYAVAVEGAVKVVDVKSV